MADPKASWENRRFRGQSRPGRTGSNGLETREHTDRTEEAQEGIGELEGADAAGHIKRNNQGNQPGSTSGSSRVTKLGNRQGAVNDILEEKSASGDVQQNSTGAPIFQPPQAPPLVNAALTATMLPVFVPSNVVPGAGYNTAGELLVLGGTFSEQAVLIVTTVKTVLGQDETDYTVTEDNGTFTGGSGYAISDTINMSDGTVVVVDNVSGGAVTEFHITTISTDAHSANNDTITQLFTSGEPGGTGFTMTLDVANQGAFGAVHKEAAEIKIGDYTVLPTDPVATSGAPFGSNAATFNVDWGVLDVTVTNGGSGYTSPPDVSAPDAGGGEEAGLTAVLTGDSVTSVTVTSHGGGYVARALPAVAAPP